MEGSIINIEITSQELLNWLSLRPRSENLGPFALFLFSFHFLFLKIIKIRKYDKNKVMVL